MKKLVFVISLLTLLAFTATNQQGLFPAHFPETVYSFDKNPLSKEKILLGRVLFYDPVLSANDEISCASCHSPYNAFTHVDHTLSHGIYDSIGTRNAPALMNLAWQSSFMWDGAINHLDMQALAPISHKGEMASSILEVVGKLNRSTIYPRLFYEAYGDSIATGEHTLKAISQFMLTLISANSKYDQVLRKEASFSEQELKGYEIFKTNCNSCHQEPLFSTYAFANNGLSVNATLNDLGKMTVSGNPKDSLLFKIPSLRNIEYSYPYMHDGSFESLGEVLNHYSEEKLKTPSLAKDLREPIQLSSNDKVDLTAFLLCLSDPEFIFNKENAFPKETLLPSKEGY